MTPFQAFIMAPFVVLGAIVVILLGGLVQALALDTVDLIRNWLKKLSQRKSR